MVRIIRITASVFYKHIGTKYLRLLGSKNRNLIQIRVSKKEFVGWIQGNFPEPNSRKWSWILWELESYQVALPSVSPCSLIVSDYSFFQCLPHSLASLENTLLCLFVSMHVTDSSHQLSLLGCATPSDYSSWGCHLDSQWRMCASCPFLVQLAVARRKGSLDNII